MNIQTEHVRHGRAKDLTAMDDGSLTIVYGEGGGCVLNISGAAKVILVPLHGALHLTTSIYAGVVHAGDVIVTENGAHAKLVGNGRAKWIALLAGAKEWQRILNGLGMSPVSGTLLLPAFFAANNSLRRRAISVARVAEMPVQECAINAVIHDVIELQGSLREVLARCPGRTHAKRLKAFLRLQRVRNHIINCCDQGLNNDVLASMANYSPCHFLCVFERVFLETPHDLLVNERLRRARDLLHTSTLAITEVAVASGFESRSAFSRLFRRRFGNTASEERNRIESSLMPA